MSRGVSTGADDVFLLDESFKGETDVVRVPISAEDFGRYRCRPSSGTVIIFPYEVSEGTSELMPESRLKRDFPATFEHLAAHRKELKERGQYQKWYGYSAPRSLDKHDHADLLVPVVSHNSAERCPASNVGR